MLTFTEAAQRAIARLIAAGAEPLAAGLRIAVTDGGCSGLQYTMNLVEAKTSDDIEVRCGRLTVFVASSSARLLEGVKVDFVDSLDGSGFRFENPNATQQCGCGSSFAA